MAGYDLSNIHQTSYTSEAKVYTTKATEEYIKGLQTAANGVKNIPAAYDQLNAKVEAAQADVADITVEAEDVLKLIKDKGIKIHAADKDGNETSRIASIAVSVGENTYKDKDGNDKTSTIRQYAINGAKGTLTFRCGEFKDKDDKGEEFTTLGSTSVVYQKFNGKGKAPTTYKNAEILAANEVDGQFKTLINEMTANGFIRFFDYEKSSVIFDLRKQIAANLAELTSKVEVDEKVGKVDKDGNPVLDADGKQVFEATGNKVEKDAEYVSVRDFKTADGSKAQSLVISSRTNPEQQVQINLNPNGGVFINVTDFTKTEKDGKVVDRAADDKTSMPYRTLIKKAADVEMINNPVIKATVKDFKEALDKARSEKSVEKAD